MSIVTLGTVLGFSSDDLRNVPAEIGKFIPKVGVAAGVAEKAGAKSNAKTADKSSGGTFVDGSRERNAKALAAGSNRVTARSREDYVKALTNRSKSLPEGAVASVASAIINGVKAGRESQETVVAMYRACFLDACSGVSQTARGDFQDDNKGVA